MADATAAPVGGNVGAEARWTAADDVLLKDALQQTGDFDRTAKSVKFSVRMSARELEQRWQQLLYDEALATQAATAMASAQPPKRVMWTEAEEETLMREASKREFRGFISLLENPALRPIFHSTRTAKSMEAHYYRMKSRAAKAAAAAAGPNAEDDGDEEKLGGDGEDRPEENFSDMEDQLADELASPPAVMDKAATRAYKKGA